jgi:CPA1 family monovalent cation:H+ antiporter
MDATHLFELAIVMVMAIIALRYAADRLRLPPSLALLTGGAALAFLPGLPTLTVDPGLVLVIFLPPLLLDGAWTIPVARLRRHMVGIGSLAVGAVVFTCAVVAAAAHLLFPSLPWAACAALGAIVGPPDAIAARSVLEGVNLPRRLQILLDGESLLNDATGLVLFRFTVAAAMTGAFSLAGAISNFFLLAIGGALVGVVMGYAWVKLVRRLGDEYLMIAATALLAWTSYLVGDLLHVSGVIATVITGLIASWHHHTVFSASTRMRGASFWTVIVFLMEAAVFVLIGLSLRGVVERGGGFAVVITTLGPAMLAVLAALVVARFVWVFASEAAVRALRAAGLTRVEPLGIGGATVLSWTGVRGVVTLALALSLPANFPGHDFILMTAFAVIFGTVLVQGTTLDRVIGWAKLIEPEAEKPPLTMSQAEAAMAQTQFAVVQRLAYDGDGQLIHPMLLETYQRRATAIVDYAKRTEHYAPMLHAHFDVVLEAVAAGRRELIRLHRRGEIDDETLHELERDLDLEELSAISAKS